MCSFADCIFLPGSLIIIRVSKSSVNGDHYLQYFIVKLATVLDLLFDYIKNNAEITHLISFSSQKFTQGEKVVVCSWWELKATETKGES